MFNKKDVKKALLSAIPKEERTKLAEQVKALESVGIDDWRWDDFMKHLADEVDSYVEYVKETYELAMTSQDITGVCLPTIEQARLLVWAHDTCQSEINLMRNDGEVPSGVIIPVGDRVVDMVVTKDGAQLEVTSMAEAINNAIVWQQLYGEPVPVDDGDSCSAINVKAGAFISIACREAKRIAEAE